MKKLHLSTFLLISLVLSFSFLEFTMASPPPTGPPTVPTPSRPPTVPTPSRPPPVPTPSYCDLKCGTRCGKAGYKDRCVKYCMICCQACKCVPSGTYGNKSECPCYRDKKNNKGKPKCP